MLKKLLAGTGVLALAAAGMTGATAGVAGASKPTITAGSGSSLNCGIAAKATLSPALKNDWVQADHQTDPVAAVRAIPDTQFGSNGPVIVSAKGKSVSCTGTVTDGVNTATVTAAKFTLNNDPAHLGGTSEATCSALVSGMPPSTAEYDVTISYKSDTAKITPTTITDAVIPPSSFNITGGTISGSFAGGTSNATGVPDATTIGAAIQSAPTSSNPKPTYKQCQPTLQVKTNKYGTTAILKSPPKGLSKVSLVSGSTLAISKS